MNQPTFFFVHKAILTLRVKIDTPPLVPFSKGYERSKLWQLLVRLSTDKLFSWQEDGFIAFHNYTLSDQLTKTWDLRTIQIHPQIEVPQILI